jgi:hypothetical protein
MTNRGHRRRRRGDAAAVSRPVVTMGGAAVGVDIFGAKVRPSVKAVKGTADRRTAPMLAG